MQPLSESGSAPVGLHAQAVGRGLLQPSHDDGPALADWRISETQLARARAVFLAGGSIGAAARAGAMAWGTARRLLEPDVAGLGRPLVTWQTLSAAQVAEAAGLRQQGWSYRALAERYGVTRTAVSRRLRAQAGESSL